MRTGKAWSWIVAAIMVALAAYPLVAHWLTNPPDQRLVDLDVYRTGGQALLEGLPVYDVITPAPQLLPFTYPPIAAMMAVPLGMMSWPLAQWVWTIAILVALLVVAWFAFRDKGVGGVRLDARGLGLGFLAVMCLYLMPIRDQIRFGQVDLFLVALCLLDCVVKRPWWPRGMLIGLATAIKLTPGVFLIYLALTAREDREQRHALFTAAGTAAFLTLLPFALIPQDAADFWFGALLDSERLGANAATTNQSLRGMLLRLYLPETLTTVLWLAAVAFIGWYGFRAARRAYLDGDVLTAVALTGLMAVLLSPVAWIHHLAWVIIVLAALAATRPLLALGVWLFYVLPIPWWGAYIKGWEIPLVSPTLGKIVQNAFGLGAIALVWLLARKRARQ